jgi:hypothetical protein
LDEGIKTSIYRNSIAFAARRTVLVYQKAPSVKGLRTRTHSPVDNSRENLWITPVDNVDTNCGKVRPRILPGVMGISPKVIHSFSQARITLIHRSYPQFPPLYYQY